MRTNVVLDDSLIEEARLYSKAKTKRELIDEALRELISIRKRRNLLDLHGKIQFSPNYDHKRLR